MQISFAVTAKLISAFVFTTRIVQSLYFLYTKFQASTHLVWFVPTAWFVSDLAGNPEDQFFSQRGSYVKERKCLPCQSCQVQHSDSKSRLDNSIFPSKLGNPILSVSKGKLFSAEELTKQQIQSIFLLFPK